jgi:hypothetical protein
VLDLTLLPNGYDLSRRAVALTPTSRWTGLRHGESSLSIHIGIGFTADGNYYGNRMSATVPFNLNGTVANRLGRQLLS